MQKKFIATVKGESTAFSIEEASSHELKITTEKGEQSLDVTKIAPHHYSVLVDGVSHDIRFYQDGKKVSAFLNGEVLHFELEDALKAARSARAGAGPGAMKGPAKIESMMPGKIVSVKVKVGDEVIEGQGIAVLEAMKMENELASPKAGKVTEVLVKEGQSVESGTVLAVIE